MDFKLKFKPKKYVINSNNYNDALIDFMYRYMPIKSCYSTGSLGRNGSSYLGRVSLDHDYIYVYNAELFKRGKHKGKNKEYVFYLYQIPMALLEMTKMDIIQKRRNVIIKTK